MDHTIYLLRTREFINANEPTYKIGKTIQTMERRLAGYPKGSEVCLTRKVHNCHEVERQIISTFHKSFVFRKEYGNEYFTGNFNDMCFIINHIVWQEDLNHRNVAINKIIRQNIKNKEEESLIKINGDPYLFTGTEQFFEDMIENVDISEHDAEMMDDLDSLPIVETKTKVIVTNTRIISKQTRKTLETFYEYLYDTRPEWYLEEKFVSFDVIEEAYRTYFADNTSTVMVISRMLNGELFTSGTRSSGVTKKKLVSYDTLRTLF